MASDWETLTALSSVVLRLSSYVFLRWIPGHVLPPVIFGSLITYLFAFKKSLDNTPRLQLVAEEEVTTLLDADGSVVAEEKDVLLADANGRPALEIDSVVVDDEHDSRADSPVVIAKEDTVFLGERPPRIFRSLLSGLPTPNSAFWNLMVVLLHVLPTIMTADLVYRAPLLHPNNDLSFVKLGYVSQETANILVREADPGRLPLTLSIRGLGPVGSGPYPSENAPSGWRVVGQAESLSDESDFTYPFHMSGLRSSHVYAYLTSNGFNGTFTTAPKIGRLQPDTNKFTFLSSSCIKPHFPYNPFAHPLSLPGFEIMSRKLASLKPSFMLFLGDWVYVDVPRRLGFDKETYRREYRQVHASPDWPAVSGIPWIHVIDDHEIANDWDKNTTHPFPAAIDAYDIYHGSVNPPAPREPLGATWRVFDQGPASFFLMDTRRYRKDSSLPDGPGKTMLGEPQLYALLNWVKAPAPDGVRWKIVVSSIPFTRNWRINARDTWAGYLHERRTILEKMWDAGASSQGVGVVVLSGDRHEFAATSFPPPRDGRWPISATVHEFSASPLSMFYLPFRSYWEENEKALAEGREEDICIKYIPDGNSKFGAIELENEVGGEQSRLHYRLFVDGEERWSYNVMSPPKGRGGRAKEAVWA